MKSNSVQQAYRSIRPDEEAKARMLNKILSSSELLPMGKDERKMRRKMKPMMIAAIIALMLILMGCAVIALGLQEMKIGEISSREEILDSECNVVKESENILDVISLHGFYGSPTYLAHQEWYQFKEEYEAEHIITEEENVFVPPEAYEAYSVYNQEMIDKVDEIAEKYNLKLLGIFAPFQRSERRIFHEATGVDSLLIPDSAAVIEKESGYFYEGGNFKVEFSMTMFGKDDQWGHTMYNTMYYSKTDYFDTVYCVISNSDDWKQWNYTTSTGAEILIAQAKSGYGACIFCFREDALIYVGIDGYYQDDAGKTTFMTNRQLEQVAEQFDYALKVESVDIDLAKEELGRFSNTKPSEQTAPWQEFTDYESFVLDKIAKLGDQADIMYYCHLDLQGDGIEELILGSINQIDSVWTMTDGRVNLIVAYGENYRELEAQWPNMDQKPILEYSNN